MSYEKCNAQQVGGGSAAGYPPVPGSEGSGLCTLPQWGAARLSQSYWLFPIQRDQQGGVWNGPKWHNPAHVSLCAQWKYNGIAWRPDSLVSRELDHSIVIYIFPATHIHILFQSYFCNHAIGVAKEE